MTAEVTLTCPLGSVCEEIKDNVMHRCRWYVSMSGEDPQSGEKFTKSECAMSWVPVLLIENTRESSRLNASISSLRNETVLRQDAALRQLEKGKDGAS